MTATQPKTQLATDRKIFRAKVTGRHAITLPAELCRQLDIRVGDSVELMLKDGVVTLRPEPVLPITALRGILKAYFPDSQSIREYLEEERSGWDEREKIHDQIWEGKWPRYDRSED